MAAATRGLHMAVAHDAEERPGSQQRYCEASLRVGLPVQPAITFANQLFSSSARRHAVSAPQARKILPLSPPPSLAFSAGHADEPASLWQTPLLPLPMLPPPLPLQPSPLLASLGSPLFDGAASHRICTGHDSRPTATPASEV